MESRGKRRKKIINNAIFVFMKHIFKEQLEGGEDVSSNVWQDCVIVFDTNVLLNLYRYNQGARDELISMMKSYQDKLWIPYQVGLEFLLNRENVISWLHKGFDDLKAQVDECKKGFFKFFEEKYAKHQLIKRAELEKLFDKQLKPIKNRLDKWEKTIPDYSNHDVVKDEILALYENRVGEDYKSDELLEIYSKGKVRFENSIPPGYKDANKKTGGARQVYGDLILWLQILDYAKFYHKNVIFVGDDLKDDWWEKEKGQISQPRKELIKEFRDKTGTEIVFHTTKGFIKASKKKLNQKTIKEVERVREEDMRWRESLKSIRPEELGYWSPLALQNLKTISVPSFDEIQKVAMNQNLTSIASLQESLKKIQEHAGEYTDITDRIKEMTGSWTAGLWMPKKK